MCTKCIHSASHPHLSLRATAYHLTAASRSSFNDRGYLALLAMSISRTTWIVVTNLAEGWCPLNIIVHFVLLSLFRTLNIFKPPKFSRMSVGSHHPDNSWLMAPSSQKTVPVTSNPIRTFNRPKPLHTIDSILHGSSSSQESQNLAFPSTGSMQSIPISQPASSQRMQESSLPPNLSRQYTSKSAPLSLPALNLGTHALSLPTTGFGQNPSNVVQFARPTPLLHSRNSAFTLTKTARAVPARRNTGITKQTRNVRPRSPTQLRQDAPNQWRQQQPPVLNGAAAAPQQGSSIFPHPSLLRHYHMGYMQFGLHQLNSAFFAAQQTASLWNTANSSIAKAPAQVLPPLQPARVVTFPHPGPKYVLNPQTSRVPSFVNATGFTEHQITRTPNPLHNPDIQTTPTTSSPSLVQPHSVYPDPAPPSNIIHAPPITRVSSAASNELAPNSRKPPESLTHPSIDAEPASNLLSYIEHLPPTPFIQPPPEAEATTHPHSIPTPINAQPQPALLDPRSSPENIIAPIVPTPPVLIPDPAAPPLRLPLLIDTSDPGSSTRPPLPSPTSAFAMLDEAQKARAKSHRSLRSFWKAQLRWRRDSRKACSWSKKDEVEYKKRTQEKLDRHNRRMERADREEMEARAILCLSPLSPNAPMVQLPFVMKTRRNNVEVQ